MIIRIVKMNFRPEEVGAFQENFEKNKEKIRAFEGCEGLQLLRDINHPSRFFTYSFWQSTDHLEAYRKSELFQGVWKFTKSLFANRAEAWSVNQLEHLP